MRYTWLIPLAALSLAGCEGPWDGLPPGDADDPQLEVALLLVGGRAFDTLRLSAPLSMDQSAPVAAWLDSARSSAILRRLDVSDSLVYRPLSTSNGVWTPVRTTIVPPGSRWTLSVHAFWSDASGNRRESWIEGQAHVPSVGSIAGPVLAPAFAHSSSFASGGDAGPELPESTRDSLAHGICPWIALRGGDTIWYPLGGAVLADPEGRNLSLPFLPLRVPLRRDAALWGGAWVDLRFDSTRARVLDARTLRRHSDSPPSLDSLHYPGSHRFLGKFPASDDKTAGWPGELRLELGRIDVTGKVAVRVWFPEPGIFDWWAGQSSAASGNGLLRPTVSGGQGWFAGAAVDSIELFVRSTGDTIPLPTTRAAWCKERGC